MSSLLQSTGSSPYVLVHIVGPLAATIASVFKVLQSCNAGRLAGQFYVTDHSSNSMSSCHKDLAMVRTSSCVQNNISKSALPRSVYIIA